jgi:mRNA degradation ribonuclease J1/J2
MRPSSSRIRRPTILRTAWLRQFGLRYVQSHCSGHMCGADLKELIGRIKPKELYPVHTEHPGMFKGLTKTVMVKQGKSNKI